MPNSHDLNSHDEWRRVDELFQAALERATAERGPFLDRACEGEPRLRAEVEKMLAYEEKAENFIDSAEVPAEFAHGSSSIDEGRFLPGDLIAGRYRVVALVGRGGM